MIRAYGQVLPNFMHTTLLDQCFQEKEKEQHKILAAKVMNYLMTTKSDNNNHRDIILRSFWDILNCKMIKDDLIDFLELTDEDDEYRYSFHRQIKYQKDKYIKYYHLK